MRLIPEEGTDVLVSGPQGALVVKREIGGTRVVTLAFDLREAAFAARESLPVLMANIIDWVRPSAGGKPEQRVSAGETYLWRSRSAAGNLRVTGPGGRFWSYPVGPEPVRFHHTDHLGIYTFESNGRLEQLAVNLLDARESRIEANPEIEGRSDRGGRGATGEIAYDGWPFLVLLGAFVLLVEWLIWTRYN